MVKCKTNHGKSEEKGEFGSPWSDSLGFKCGTPVTKKKGDTNESKTQNSHRYPSDPSCHHNCILSGTITLSRSPSIVAVQYHSP